MSDKNSEKFLIEQEWSYFIEADIVDSKPVEMNISPPKDVFSALSSRLGVYSIESIAADLKLKRNMINKAIEIVGKIKADLHQECIVTAEPVQEHVEETFEAWFSDPNNAVSFAKARRERMNRKEKNEQPMIEEYDDPEPIVNGQIDLGELVVQHLSLALNPYPRKDGVEYNNLEVPLKDAPAGTYDNPFAALKDWKEREAKKDKS